MDGHNAGDCPDCTIQQLEANGHSMRMIIPCEGRTVYWACLTCDVVEKWPVIDDIKASNEILKALIYVHCLDNLVLSE